MLPEQISRLGWDFDGVIADSRQFAWAAGRRIMQLFDRDRDVGTPEAYHELFSIPAQIAAVGTDHAPALRLMHRLVMRHNAPRMRLFENVLEVVARVKVGQVIVTSSFADGCRLALGERVRYFQQVAGFEIGRKPEILPKLVPTAGLYITDSAGDIKICRKAAIPSVAVTWGFDSIAQLERAEPDHLVREVEELQAVLGLYGLLR